MPNWCNNHISLKHSDPAMIERAYKALCAGEFLNEFIPVPLALKETVAGSFGDPEKQAALEKSQQDNLNAHNYKDWYDFCCGEWGTKWDVGGDDGLIQKLSENCVEASFDSAWAPPCAAYEKLIEQGFIIKAYYDEPGMCFCGVWEGDSENGFFDDHYDYGGQTSETVRDAIGAELDDFWDISNRMAEWEDEENQEIDLDGGLSATNE